MDTGINSYIFITAIILGLGLITILTAKETVRVIIGLSVLFSASVINIAAFSGFKNFNPEAQVIMFLTAFVCLLNITAGIALIINHYKVYKSNSINDAVNNE